MIGIAAKIAKGIAGLITGGLVDKVLEAYRLYQSGAISEAEFESRVKISAQETAAKVEEGWAQAASSISGSVQTTLAASPVLQRAWAAVLILQAAVLLWHQIGTSVYQVLTGEPWPAPMANIEWSYLLIGAMIGAGPFVFRRGAAK